MTQEQNNVKEFMRTFGQATPDKPIIPDVMARGLRVKLLLEEVLELAEASGVLVRHDGAIISSNTASLNLEVSGDVDLVGVADALADIDYVNQGAAVAYGLNLEPFQTEVHRSNMTKLWKKEELNVAEANGYEIIPKDNGNYLVKNKDGKVVKSPSYSKADLKSVLEKQS